MIGKILTGIMSLIISLVNVLLTPINSIISTYLPSLDSAFSSLAGFFTLIGNGIGWVIDSVGIPSSAIGIIVLTWTFKLSVPLLVSSVKLAIKWYDKLKP